MPMPSPAVGRAQIPLSIPPPPGSMAPVLKFNGYGEFSGLLYHSPHSVVYEDDLYPTALHLYEARKFLDHRPDLAEQIRQCENVEEITAMSAQLAEFTRRDWGNIALVTVSDRISHCACFGLTCAESEGGCSRWMTCYTSSSGSTATCARCFLIHSPPI